MFANSHRNIQLDITQHSDKNYFSRSIDPVYANCHADSGTSKLI